MPAGRRARGGHGRARARAAASERGGSALALPTQRGRTGGETCLLDSVCRGSPERMSWCTPKSKHARTMSHPARAPHPSEPHRLRCACDGRAHVLRSGGGCCRVGWGAGWREKAVERTPADGMCECRVSRREVRPRALARGRYILRFLSLRSRWLGGGGGSKKMLFELARSVKELRSQTVLGGVHLPGSQSGKAHPRRQ